MKQNLNPHVKLSELLKQLKLPESEWEIDYDFTKGALNSQRGVVVEVSSLKSGKKKRKSVLAGSKNDARNKVLIVAKELVMELSR